MGEKPDEGLLYGGQAQHGHESSHVGTEQTFGEPTGANRARESGQQRQENWVNRHRDYPETRGGGEDYGHRHRHGEESGDWPLGSPPGEGRR